MGRLRRDKHRQQTVQYINYEIFIHKFILFTHTLKSMLYFYKLLHSALRVN